MTRKLPTLIRLYRWQIDDERRRLADYERRCAQLEVLIEAIDNELALEIEYQQVDPIVSGQTFERYAARVLKDRQRVQKQLAAIQEKAAAAQTALSEMFWERRRIELIEEQACRQHRYAAERREANSLADQTGMRLARVDNGQGDVIGNYGRSKT